MPLIKSILVENDTDAYARTCARHLRTSFRLRVVNPARRHRRHREGSVDVVDPHWKGREKPTSQTALSYA